MMRLQLREEAEADILDAFVRYERERRGLGSRFERELDHTMTRVQENPLHFPEIEDGARRALLRTFPFGIFFCVEHNTITVLGVLHLHRHPQTWKRRL